MVGDCSCSHGTDADLIKARGHGTDAYIIWPPLLLPTLPLHAADSAASTLILLRLLLCYACDPPLLRCRLALPLMLLTTRARDWAAAPGTGVGRHSEVLSSRWAAPISGIRWRRPDLVVPAAPLGDAFYGEGPLSHRLVGTMDDVIIDLCSVRCAHRTDSTMYPSLGQVREERPAPNSSGTSPPAHSVGRRSGDP